MDKKDIPNFQQKQLVLLQYLDSFCDSHHLTYYLIGGTLLGAIRHKGFIPWDIDIDVAMPRNHYSQFIDFMLKHEDDTFYLESYQNEKHHFSPHAILRIKNTHVILKGEEYKSSKLVCNGLYLDIFPLDEAPDSCKLQNKQAKKIKIIRRILYYKSYPIFEKNKFLSKFFKKILCYLLSPISCFWLGKKLEKAETKYNNGNGKYLVSMSSHYSYSKQLMDRKIYGNPCKVIFEGMSLNAPENYKEYLTQLYGSDYLEIPKSEHLYDDAEGVTFVDER